MLATAVSGKTPESPKFPISSIKVWLNIECGTFIHRNYLIMCAHLPQKDLFRIRDLAFPTTVQARGLAMITDAY